MKNTTQRNRKKKRGVEPLIASQCRGQRRVTFYMMSAVASVVLFSLADLTQIDRLILRLSLLPASLDLIYNQHNSFDQREILCSTQFILQTICFIKLE